MIKLFKKIPFVVGLILGGIICCCSANETTNITEVQTSNEEALLTTTLNSLITSTPATSLQSEISLTSSLNLGTQQTYSLTSESVTTHRVTESDSTLILSHTSSSPVSESSLIIAATNSSVGSISSTELSSASKVQITTQEVYSSDTTTTVSSTPVSSLQTQESISLSSSSSNNISTGTYLIGDAEISLNLSSHTTNSQVSGEMSFQSEIASTTTIDATTLAAAITTSSSTTPTTAESQTTAYSQRMTEVSLGLGDVGTTSGPSTTHSTLSTFVTAISEVNLPSSFLTTHSVMPSATTGMASNLSSPQITEAREITVHPLTETTEFISPNLSTQEISISSATEIQISSQSSENSSPIIETATDYMTTAVEITGELRPETSDEGSISNVTETFILLETSSPNSSSLNDTSETLKIEVSENIEEERLKKYWRKSDLFLVIGVMFVLNILNLIIVVYCVLHITRRRQRWEKPPMRYGDSRILYNNSPQVECISAVRGRDLATDSECKNDENNSEDVPVIRIDEGWCVPIHKDGKGKEKQEDTGV